MSLKAEKQTNPNNPLGCRPVFVPREQRLTDNDTPPDALIRRARLEPHSLTSQDLLQLQRTIGNRASMRLLRSITPKAESVPKQNIQRFAFINEQQITTVDPAWSQEMKTMISDNLIRNYVNQAEFKNHAAQNTDYLGNLAATSKYPGTWLRFSPTGINILGERHTEVQDHDVFPAVGTKSFIDEQLSSDVMVNSSSFKQTYLEENKTEFKRFGIENELDKRKFGAESLLAKMGFVMNLALPYFEKRNPINDLKTGNYTGQPVQRYLRIAWGFSKDNVATLDFINMISMILPAQWGAYLLGLIPPKMSQLATVHKSLTPQLDPFVASLTPEGYLGDELDKPANAGLYDPLAKFARAFADYMVEVGSHDPQLKDTQRKQLLATPSTSETERDNYFSIWRNYSIENNVRAAAQKGIRYAGMGINHMNYLINAGLPANAQTYDMVNFDIDRFKALTARLRQKAKTVTP